MRFTVWSYSPDRIEFGMGETGVPGEKPLRARTRTNNKLNPHLTPSLVIEFEPHWWEADALTTAPSQLPHACKPVKSTIADDLRVLIAGFQCFLIILEFS